MKYASSLLAGSVLFGALASALPFEERAYVNYAPQVITAYGGVNVTYQGFLNTTTGVEQFLGMHYAMPPLGARRFKRPEPWVPSSNLTIYNATAPAPVCKQPTITTSVEDCLTLDISRHTGVQQHEKLPVLLWIYGGDFVGGSSSLESYNSAGLVQNSVAMGVPIVVVKLNYRLHAYGFMMGDAAQKANATNVGLLDQRLALEWIQEHIHAFGGDPEKVTIFGASAGGTSIVSQLILEGMEDKKLFRGAQYMSGAFAQNFDRQATFAVADQLYSFTNCTANVTNDQIGCLQSLSEDALFKQVVNTLKDYSGDAFGPYNDTVVFPTHPSVLIREGNFAKVPIIAGNVLDEAGYYVPTTVASDNEAYGLAGKYFTFATGKNASTIWPYYSSPNLTDVSPHYDNASTLASLGAYYPPFCTMAGDTWFGSGREFVIKTQMDRGLPLWVYKFGEEYPVQSAGVYHYMDIPFWFSSTTSTDPGQLALAKSMTRALISFTVTQDPAAISGVNWDSYYKDQSYLFWKAENTTMMPNVEHRDAFEYILSLYP